MIKVFFLYISTAMYTYVYHYIIIDQLSGYIKILSGKMGDCRSKISQAAIGTLSII